MGQQTRPSPSGWRGKGPQQQAAPFLFLLGLCCLHRRELGAGYVQRGKWLCCTAGGNWFLHGWREPLENSRSVPYQLLREGCRVWGSELKSPAFLEGPSHLVRGSSFPFLSLPHQV